MTADSEQMVRELDSSQCGSEKWEKDCTQDLTDGGGCLDIGLLVPSLSLELARLEIRETGGKRESFGRRKGISLYLGQPSTDRASKINSGMRINERRTSYGARLVKCSEPKKFEPEAMRLVMRGKALNMNPVPLVILILNLSVLVRK